jgi:hypothetical protein
MPPNDDRRAITVYLGFTLAFSSIFYFLIAKSGHVGGGSKIPGLRRPRSTSSP